MDTGPSVQGRQVDVYMWSCNEALRVRPPPIHLTVLRLGWNPRATTPSFLDRLLQPPADRLSVAAAARPLPQDRIRRLGRDPTLAAGSTPAIQTSV